VPAPVGQWGDPNVVRERLGNAVTGLAFDRGMMFGASLSPRHSLLFFETTFGPLMKLVADFQSQPEKLEKLRAELTAIIAESVVDNQLRQHFLISRAIKA
jgi:hypothetical protein